MCTYARRIIPSNIAQTGLILNGDSERYKIFVKVVRLKVHENSHGRLPDEINIYSASNYDDDTTKQIIHCDLQVNDILTVIKSEETLVNIQVERIYEICDECIKVRRLLEVKLDKFKNQSDTQLMILHSAIEVFINSILDMQYNQLCKVSN
jgi:hypothetical protein